MSTYHLRRATLRDAETLARQRLRMFEDMGVMRDSAIDAQALSDAFVAWLHRTMPAETYVAWVVEDASLSRRRDIVAGAGATILPWPPGPAYPGDRLAFVYNVYTEPSHRGRGLARLLMETIHAHCRETGIGSVALNASAAGVPLYESMGYRASTSPMMFLSLESSGV